MTTPFYPRKITEELLESGVIELRKDTYIGKPDSDPFNIGTPAHLADATWLADLYHERGMEGLHLRDIHYEIYNGGESVMRPQGDLYGIGDPAGTEAERAKAYRSHWSWLSNTYTKARWFGLLPWSGIDKRTKDYEAWRGAYGPWPHDDPGVQVLHSTLRIPDFAFEDAYKRRTTFEVDGYGIHPLDRGVNVEIFVEKEHAYSVVAPLADRWRLTLAASQGNSSIEQARRLLQRAPDSIPTRVLWLSDDDVNGRVMPRAMSRQVEAFQRIQGLHPDKDIAIRKVALTTAQAEELELVPAPDSSGDQPRYELNALRQKHPNFLAGQIEGALDELLDDSVDDETAAAEQTAQDAVQEQWSVRADAYERILSRIRAEANAVIAAKDEELQRLDAELEPLRKRAGRAGERLDRLAADFDPEMPDRPEVPRVTVGEDWMFHSKRSYFEQLQSYKMRRES